MMAKKLLLLLTCLLLANLAEAATYTFRHNSNEPNSTPGNAPGICSGSWSRSGSTFTCNGNISLASGDVLDVGQGGGGSALTDITVVATGNITLTGNTVGTVDKNISLQTSWGALSASGTNTINGSLTSGSGAIDLSNSTVSGSVTSNGTIALTAGLVQGNVSGRNGVTTSGAQIAGTVVSSNESVVLIGGSVQGDVSGKNGVTTSDVQIAGTMVSSNGSITLTGGSVQGDVSGKNGVTTSGTQIAGSLNAASGAINLSGGSVGGLVTSGCCMVTSNGTDLLGGARSNSSGISISGGTIAGSFYANKNPAVFSAVTMTSGSVSGASSITFSGSTLGTASTPVSVTAVSDAVTLNNTIAYGDFVAPNYSTVQVNSPSVVYGTCRPGSTPPEACGPLPSERLTLAWSMDESAWSGTVGEVLDSSGNGLHGRAYNGVTTGDASPALPAVAGQGTCRYGSFSSTSRQYLQTADNSRLDLTGSFTIGVWVRPKSRASQLMSILSKDTNYEFHIKPDGTINWWWQTTSGNTREFDSTRTVPLNTWTHVVIRYTANNQQIFINGVLDRTASLTGTLLTNTNPLQVGQDQNYDGRYFNGDLDEVRIYSEALNNAQIRALYEERHPCLASSVHHYRLGFSTPMLSCKPIPVTVTACADSSCSSTVSTSDSITLLPAGAWIGGDGKTFANGDTLTAYLKRAAGTRVLGVSGASYDCSPADCTLVIQDSGFVFSNLTPMIAGKPQSAVIQAVKKDDATQACMPAFTGGPRTLQFSAAYVTPGTGSLSPSVAGVPLEPVGSSKNVSLSFDAEAKAAIEVVYADAGEVSLTASYVGAANPGNPAASEELLSMSGSASFVSRPYGLCLQTDALPGSDYSATSSLFPGDVRAGDSFDLTIKPVIWTAASDAGPPLQAGAICSNPTTPNYQQSGIALTLDELNGGHAGVLGVSSHDHPRDIAPPLDGVAVIEQSISEVGVFRLTATPPDYLGASMGHAVSQSGRVGRFIPAYFKVEGAASVRPACGNAFSYQGQPMPFASGLEPNLTVTAYSRLHNVTRNYDRPGFWKLAAPVVGSYASVTAELLDPADPDYASTVQRDARLASQGTPVLAVTGADDGDGARQYTWSGQELLYAQPLVPGLADYPFRARIRQDFSATSLTDNADGVDVCHGDGSSCQPYGYVFADSPGSEVRLGRLRIGNAHGSELQGLSLPLFLESWRDTAGGSFQIETMDTCTVLGATSLGAFTGNLASGETAPTTSEPLAGVGSLRLTAPGAGNDGSVRVGFPALPLWLQYPWDGTVRQGASGLATFGIYRGPAPLIFRRELYRQ